MSEYIVRFSRRQRAEHVAVMSLFAVLALTGLPQRFFEAGWAQTIVVALGGIDRVRWFHRIAGLLFSILLVTHVSTIIIGLGIGRMTPTLLPTRKDFHDTVIQLRYYLGLTDEEAKFGRFDYRQKFEYWGLLLGGVGMVATGLALYFPVIVTRWLPGEFIPMAKVIHSNEGLMAFLIVILWHVYNAHLAPEVFPFDTSIFTGTISRERLQKDHPLEHDAHMAHGALDAHEPPAAIGRHG
jgi:formate dehydrogenase subunit gamma